MTALDFINKKTKMCDTYECCHRCPLGSRKNGKQLSCYTFISMYPEEAIRIVDDWIEEVKE